MRIEETRFENERLELKLRRIFGKKDYMCH
jgi:hypothetical protein